MKLFTIGYQAATQAELIERLKGAGVQVLVDVRAVAASRRAGFSKKLLAAGLADAGIDYVHLRALGTPPAGRLAARAGRTAEMQAIYNGYLDNEPAAQAELAEAADISAARPTALLCLEADANVCHRSLIAGRLARRAGFEVVDL
ncbi:MAG TPA: DUF488 domain-containing protein [Caulobacteraceae bacterium]|jgi:uncharacterized protein (DUF488 family)|nr:DUF488 domain-containing protein [Caulobacteraceae bacterium]